MDTMAQANKDGGKQQGETSLDQRDQNLPFLQKETETTQVRLGESD